MATDDSVRGIAAERWEELREFRTTHPPKLVTVDGENWEYIASGESEKALLILPGGAMVGEASFTRIPAFEDRYRVIAPSYASVSTAAELRRCYPQARVHTFHGAGHTPWISHKEEYLSVIKEFLH
jgi:hypothetical protein